MYHIGGFLELEIKSGQSYHELALAINSGRNALKYLLLSIKPKLIYLPRYICEDVVVAVSELSIPIEFYSIDSDFYPTSIPILNTDDYFLYINYFGIQTNNVQNLSRKLNNVIIDNTQAFFTLPIKAIGTFYSSRKFFGVPDGGYLYSDRISTDELNTDESFDAFRHLLKRIDLGPAKAYADFKINEERINKLPIRKMSVLTQRILSSVDYKEVREKRQRNFNSLHETLGLINEIDLEDASSESPICYPLILSVKNLRNRFVENGILVPKYWPNLEGKLEEDSFENKLTNFLFPLPIDQRYGASDMTEVLNRMRRFPELRKIM